jgi:hypothetical protein
VAVVVRPADGAVTPRGAGAAIAAAAARVILGLAAFQVATGDEDGDRAIGWALLLPAALVAAGAGLALRGRLRAARVLLMVGGFLGVPLGLFAILAGREAGAALRADPGDVRSAAPRS